MKPDKILPFAPALLWTLVLFILTSIPKVPTPDLGFNAQDKLFHLIAYAIFGWLWLHGALHHRPQQLVQSVRLVVGWGLFYAAFDELHQEWIPGRFGDFWDWVANAAGILLAAGLFYRLNRNKSTTLLSDPDSV